MRSVSTILNLMCLIVCDTPVMIRMDELVNECSTRRGALCIQLLVDPFFGRAAEGIYKAGPGEGAEGEARG